jgi:chromosome partitioning protein
LGSSHVSAPWAIRTYSVRQLAPFGRNAKNRFGLSADTSSRLKQDERTTRQAVFAINFFLASQSVVRLNGRLARKLADLPTDFSARQMLTRQASQKFSNPAGNSAKKPTCQKVSFRATVQSMLIALANTKGGVGKSTLAVHLAVWCFDQGATVAVIDADKQGLSSRWTALAEPKIEIRRVGTPDECLSIAQELLQSHDFVVGDCPGGLDDVSRTLLILAGLAVLPITPSILDLWSVKDATTILQYAQKINGGRPEGRLVLNRIKKREKISRELREAVPSLGLVVSETVIHDRSAYRDAAQQGTVVGRMGKKVSAEATEIDRLFRELLAGTSVRAQDTADQFNDKEAPNG